MIFPYWLMEGHYEVLYFLDAHDIYLVVMFFIVFVLVRVAEIAGGGCACLRNYFAVTYSNVCDFY